jgi:two-component system KDP operon response regulator KdpE
VLRANDGQQALRAITEQMPDLVLLDVMMPDMDGFETLKRIREHSTVPVIMLTAKSEELDKVSGLSLGADDYITKPFSNRELAARIKAVLRRTELPAPLPKSTVTVDDELQIDFSRNEAIVRGERIKLRPTEYRMLYHLVANAGRLLTHESLLARVWGPDYLEEDHYVRLYITYLRQKIEPNPKRPKYILSERGLGYRFIELNDDVKRQAREAAPSLI